MVGYPLLCGPAWEGWHVLCQWLSTVFGERRVVRLRTLGLHSGFSSRWGTLAGIVSLTFVPTTLGPSAPFPSTCVCLRCVSSFHSSLHHRCSSVSIHTYFWLLVPVFLPNLFHSPFLSLFIHPSPCSDSSSLPFKSVIYGVVIFSHFPPLNSTTTSSLTPPISTDNLSLSTHHTASSLPTLILVSHFFIPGSLSKSAPSPSLMFYIQFWYSLLFT